MIGGCEDDRVRGPVSLFDTTNSDSTTFNSYLTVEDVAALLRISSTTVRRMISNREIRFLKIRGSIRIELKDVQAYAKESVVEKSNKKLW